MPFDVYQNGAGLRIVGDFTPGSVVAVRLHDGFPGHGARTLHADVRRSLLVPDRVVDLEFARAGAVLSVRAEPALEVRTVNLDEFTIRARRVYPNNVVRMLQRGDSASMAPAVGRRVPVAAARNEDVTTRVDLRELLGAAAPCGMYEIELWTDPDSWRRQSRLVQITDLGVTVRAAGDAAAVQVVSIADGAPAAGADVRIVSPTNQELAAAATDARGVAMLRWAADGDDRSAFVVHVRHAADEAFVDLDRFAVELTDPTLGGRPFAGDDPEAFVWPTRGIVRPGERIEAAVLLRDAAGRAVAGRDVTVVLERPDGRVWRRQRSTTPGSGLVTALFDTSPDVPSGTWRIRAFAADGGAGADGTQLGNAPVQVEAFVPYRLEATVEPVAPLRGGETGTVRVTGRWLDGTPAAGQRVQLRVRVLDGSFAPPGAAAADLAGFSFDTGRAAPPFGELTPSAAVLDDEGIAELRVLLPPCAARQALTAHLLAEVLDPSGRAVRAACRAPVLRPDYQLGVRATASGVEVRAVTPDGAPLAGDLAARVRLERRSWTWDYRTVSGSRWRWETRVAAEVLGEWPVELRDGAATLAIDYPSPSGGWLAVVATTADTTASQDVGAATARPDRLRVTRSGDAVAPGGVATIAVEAPAAGRGFVTLEGRTLLDAQVVELQRGHNEIALPIPAELRVPNVHAVVTLTRPARDVGPDAGPAWLVGGVAVPLARDELAGALTLDAPAEVLPEAELACAVDAPGATSALVAVVDEGVLAITDHASPDPLAWFLAQRRLSARGADAFGALMEGAVFVAGTRTGGDDDDGVLDTLLTVGSISPRIRPLALFAEVPLDAAGRGVARFTLPPYEGRVRVMTIAAGPGTVAGTGHATVVRAPLGLLATAPRMVAPGDRFAVPITLRNDTGADGTVGLQCRAAGGLEVVTAPADVALRNGEVRSVDVEIRALEVPGAGVVPELRIAATLGAEHRTVTLPVDLREQRVLAEEYLGAVLGDAQELTIPTDFAADGLRAVLEVDAVPDVHLRPALEALIAYPYGCVEQTTSRGFALLACSALLPRIYGAEADAGSAMRVRELVQTAVDRLVGMQDARGGFGWWPGAEREYPFGTLYAVDFMHSAREQGYDVPESALRNGLQRVHAVASRDGDPSLRAYACEIESRTGAPARGLLQWLATQVTSDEARARLAMALRRLGDADGARRLLDAEGAEPVVREFGGALCSPLRTAALRLRARMEIDPADPGLPALAQGIQAALLRTSTLNTQELGQALCALAGYYRNARAVGEVVLRGTLDGAPLPAPVDGRIALPAKPGSVVELGAGGAGFALLTVRGMRTPRPAIGDGSLQVRRAFVDPDTGAEVTRLQRGRTYEVRLTGRAARPLDQVAIVDLLPGGLEPEVPPPGADAAVTRQPWRDDDVRARVERRDDRVVLFCDRTLHGEFTLSHLVRATLPGRYAAPAVLAEAMYDPSARFTGTGADGVEILP
ncbi:MAG: hypothetical protein IPM29_26730 [Planctomycetes bacterium]|nr:hypothetical protein [Planctomycetota bacterium]